MELERNRKIEIEDDMKMIQCVSLFARLRGLDCLHSLHRVRSRGREQPCFLKTILHSARMNLH